MPRCCRRAIALMASATAVAAGTMACSSGTTPQDQTGTSTTTSAAAGHGSLAHCLSEHGVPTTPGLAVGPPPGVDPGTWQRAMQACSSLAPGPAG